MARMPYETRELRSTISVEGSDKRKYAWDL
jgi:hypothetical protein